MALVYRYVAIYPSGATNPIGDDPYGDAGASYSQIYTSMSAMEAAENGDLTTAGINSPDSTELRVEIIPSDGSWGSGGAGPDTGSNVTFDGWTTDKGNGSDNSYVTIETFGTARSSDGNWDTSAYIMQTTSTGSYTMRLDNDGAGELSVDFIGVQFEHIDGSTNNGYGLLAIFGSADHLEIGFFKCHFKQQDGSTDNRTRCFDSWEDGNQATLRFKNCIFAYGDVSIMFMASNDQIVAAYFYNCTIYGSGNAVETNNIPNVYVKNCAIFDNTDDWVDTLPTTDYNACDEGAGEGTNTVDISATWNTTCFQDAGANEWQVQDALSPIYEASPISQFDDAEVPDDDIVGTSRKSGEGDSVSIGAFEFDGAPPAGVAPTSVILGPLVGPMGGPI